MAQVICSARAVCKKSDCHHAKPHTWKEGEGCSNSMSCQHLKTEQVIITKEDGQRARVQRSEVQPACEPVEAVRG